MRVVGLLSGGKDSVYNLLHCALQGHDVVCLANLRPPAGKDELDSYMYQTVGNSALDAIAEALEMPLHSRTIRGTAVNQGSSYGSRANGGKVNPEDETEDLYDLLNAVKTAQPDVEGVACGAILSNYQRVRVEHVCSRLKLVPIAFLWERDQAELLSEMIHAQMNSVLVKVAGAGLTTKHLGKSLAEMQSTLERLHQRYQLHLCGEGGEYETLTLDCPLYRRKVDLELTTEIILDDNPFATVAHLHIDKCSLRSKDPSPDQLQDLVAIPPLLDGESQHLLVLCSEAVVDETQSVRFDQGKIPAASKSEASNSAERSGWLAVGEARATEDAGNSLQDEVRSAFADLQARLAQPQSRMDELAHITLYISRDAMSAFASINETYASYFGSSPPTRACVATILPTGTNIKIEAFARRHTDDARSQRKALHVQSLSYWAAANIGPYSQAVTADDKMFVSGQIPLVPATLALHDGSFAEQAVLALQHLRRVATSAKETSEVELQSVICWLGPCDDAIEYGRKLGIARKAWKAFAGDCPAVYVQATALPKGASIEWQATYAMTREETEEEDTSVPEKHAVLLPGERPDHFAAPFHVRVFHLPNISEEAALDELEASLQIKPQAMSFICTRHLAVQKASNASVVFQVSWR